MAIAVNRDIVSFTLSPDCFLNPTILLLSITDSSSSHLPDNKGVNYQVFLRALYNFAKVEMRLGR